MKSKIAINASVSESTTVLKHEIFLAKEKAEYCKFKKAKWVSLIEDKKKTSMVL